MQYLKYQFRFFTFFYYLFFCISIHPAEGLDLVESIIQKFNDLRNTLVTNFTKEVEDDVRKKAREIAFDVININEISKLVLGKYYHKTSHKKIKKFKETFSKIIVMRIEKSNIPKNQAILKKKAKIPIQLISEKPRKDTIFKMDALAVKTKVKNKKIVYDVDIYLFRENNKLWLYDIHIDGSSTLLDFKNQFARIIREKGFDHLLTKLSKKSSISSDQSNKVKKVGKRKAKN